MSKEDQSKSLVFRTQDGRIETANYTTDHDAEIITRQMASQGSTSIMATTEDEAKRFAERQSRASTDSDRNYPVR
jgi:hypothetical protein